MFWKWWQSKQCEPVKQPVEEPLKKSGDEPLESGGEQPPETPLDETQENLVGLPLGDLLPELKRLDRLLDRAVAAAQAAYGDRAASDPFRGLHISQNEVEQLLAREPGAPTFRGQGGEWTEISSEEVREGSMLAWLKQAYSLTPFDLDVILLTLAPELDLRYERLYAYLQDDVTQRRPSVDLTLNILSTSAEAKLTNRMRFASESPLIRYNLVYLIADPQQIQPPLLSNYLKLDVQILRLLMGQEYLDPRLAPFSKRVKPAVSLDELPLSEYTKRALPTLIMQAQQTRQPLRLYFHGLHGTGKRRTAEALAGEIDIPLLVVDLARALNADADFERTLKLLFREAWLQDALLYLDGLDVLRSDDRLVQYQRLLDALAEDAGLITILAGKQPWLPAGRYPLGVIAVPFEIPDFTQRRACWQNHLISAGITLNPDDLNTLADRFRLTPNQIAEAIATACSHVSWCAATQLIDGTIKDDSTNSPSSSIESSLESFPSMGESQGSCENRETDHLQPTLKDFFTAARAQTGTELSGLAKKIEPKYDWKSIVLPEDALTQLSEICQRVGHHHRVLEEWGFGRKLSLGKGISALFAGPSGTGKTMAADVIASELGLDLYKIDLSAVVSKYIGETEKNLERVFTAAENANAILFFDEADALFGKRSEVKDAHDRYANIEIAYLLQKMEQYDGLAILATNLRQNMDEAFIRRLQFIVEFPFPDEMHRYQIWKVHFPTEAPCDEHVDFDFLAKQFRLAGGNIKNIVLYAAFLAAEDGKINADDGKINMEHLVRATKREYQKMGRVPSGSEFGKYTGAWQ